MKTHPCLLGEVELAESDSVFDEQCEVLCLDQQGLPVGRGSQGQALLVLGPCLGSWGRLTQAQCRSPQGTSPGSRRSCGSR